MSLLVVAAPVAATTMTATFYGRVTSGIDRSGVFGQAGGDLTGKHYQLSFSYDATLYPGVNFYEFEGYRSEYISDEFSSIIQSGLFSVGGRSYRFNAGDYFWGALTAACDPDQASGVDATFASQDLSYDPENSSWDYSGFYQMISNPGLVSCLSFLQPGTMRATAPSSGYFYLDKVVFDSDGNVVDFLANADGTLDVRRLTISEQPPSAVPLPAASGPFLLSLLSVGLLRRSRARKKSATL